MLYYMLYAVYTIYYMLYAVYTVYYMLYAVQTMLYAVYTICHMLYMLYAVYVSFELKLLFNQSQKSAIKSQGMYYKHSKSPYRKSPQ